MDRPSYTIGVAVLTAFALHGTAQAVNGAQPGGIGIKNAAMGGAAIALPLEATAANNPAGLAYVPASAVVDLQVFRGQSSADYLLPGNRLENSQTIPAPAAGFSQPLSPAWAAGLSVIGSGVGADYGRPALPVPGAGNAKTSLRVVEFIPAVAWKPHEDIALGGALTLARREFDVDGVVVPAPVPGGLLALPGHGKQTTTGTGWRAGVLWKPATEWSLGANSKSRTHMGRLAGYDQDVLAYSDGHLDDASQYGVGVAWQPNDRLTLAADWLRIL